MHIYPTLFQNLTFDMNQLICLNTLTLIKHVTHSFNIGHLFTLNYPSHEMQR